MAQIKTVDVTGGIEPKSVTDKPAANLLVDQVKQPQPSPVELVLQKFQDIFDSANIALLTITDEVNDTRAAYENAKEKNLKAYAVISQAQNDLFAHRLAFMQKQNEMLLNQLNLQQQK